MTHHRGSETSTDSQNFWFLSSLVLPQEGCGSWEFILGFGEVLWNTSHLDVLQCHWGRFKRLRDLVKPPVRWFANKFSKPFIFWWLSPHRKYTSKKIQVSWEEAEVFIEAGCNFWTLSHFPWFLVFLWSSRYCSGARRLPSNGPGPHRHKKLWRLFPTSFSGVNCSCTHELHLTIQKVWVSPCLEKLAAGISELNSQWQIKWRKNVVWCAKIIQAPSNAW